MVCLIPNNNINVFETTDKEWKIIKDFISYLNKIILDIPILTDNDLIDMDYFSGFLLSSKKTNVISLMVDNSIDNGILEDYKKLWKENNFSFSSFPVRDIFKFYEFSRDCGGFQIYL
jgi:hypothetical protein